MTALEREAAEYAAIAFKEITTTDPEVYGIDRPWNSVQEWIDFEMDGGGIDEVRRLTAKFKVPHREVWKTLEQAFKDIATLAELNAPFEP